MRVLIHAPILVSILALVGGQSASAEALDKAIRDVLKAEAAETSLQKGTFVEELVPEPSIIPNEEADFQALENSITIQIKQAISKNSSEAVTSDAEQNALELALENVVSSALIQGNKLDDIRNAVAAAMSDIQGTSALEEQIPPDKIQSAASALKEIVSDSTNTSEDSPQDSYIQSLRAELTSDKPVTDQVAAIDSPNQTIPTITLTQENTLTERGETESRNTLSAVDMIVATMSETPQVTQNAVSIKVAPQEKPSAVSLTAVRSTIETRPSPQNRTLETKPENANSTTAQRNETVTVLKGETLFKIAKRVYGSGEKYLALYEANKEIISDPNMIFVGQVLKVPR